MKKRLGIIQTRGIGDIIIALPIADFYIELGWEIFWPIDSKFVEMFRQAKPEINFLSVDHAETPNYDYFFNEPTRMLREKACEKIVVLYSHLGTINLPELRLASSFKFDEYKYAIAGVPFERKWRLKYERDMDREQTLFDGLNIKGDYVCIHDIGSAMKDPITIPEDLTRGLEIVRITPVTDNIFDWRLTLERASRLVMVDSCFANFVEQLNLENDKAVFLQWPVPFTPVFANGWRFIFPPRA